MLLGSDGNALVLVAHCDDETLGAGGLIQVLLDHGWVIDVVVMTDGQTSARRKPVDNVPSLNRACTLLGTHTPFVLGNRDQELNGYSIPGLTAQVEETRARMSSDMDLIVTHATTDLNSDHRVTAEIARLLVRRRTASVIGMEIPADSARNGQSFPADMYVSLTNEQMENKVAAFMEYTNEIRNEPDPLSPGGLVVMNSARGLQSGSKFAEAFEVQVMKV